MVRSQNSSSSMSNSSSSQVTTPDISHKHICLECDVSFTRKQDKDRHDKERHGSIRYECPKEGCNAIYIRELNTRNHINITHPGENLTPIEVDLAETSIDQQKPVGDVNQQPYRQPFGSTDSTSTLHLVEGAEYQLGQNMMNNGFQDIEQSYNASSQAGNSTNYQSPYIQITTQQPFRYYLTPEIDALEEERLSRILRPQYRHLDK